MATGRYDTAGIESLTAQALEDGYVVLRDHFSLDTISRWREAFLPLLERHIEREGTLQK